MSFHLKKIISIVLFAVFIISPGSLFSKDKYKRKISISQWIEDMEQFKDEKYGLSDTEIYYNSSTDSAYNFDQSLNKPSSKDKIVKKIISPYIFLKNCKLIANQAVQLRNIVFEKNVVFGACEGFNQITFYNCTFKEGVDFISSELSIIRFAYCSILQRTVVMESELGQLVFSNCTFYTNSQVVKSPFKIGYEIANQSFQYIFYFGLVEKKINSLILNRCKILPTEVTPVFSFMGGKYEKIYLTNIDFGKSILNFSSCSVKESLNVRDCKFSKPLGVKQFNFPKENTTFLWSQLNSVGLGIYEDFNNKPFTKNTVSLNSDYESFNELNSSYRKFFAMYRERGDMESANACYIQMKDMETTKYSNLYKNNKSIESWFNWRFNQFLKFFSKYGTNPVQSLIISMWTILIFAAIYFFFYSDWDGINRTFLIKKHQLIMHYFRSEQKLEEFYTDNYKEDLKNFADYKQEMLNNKNQLPFFIVILGKPLYLLSIVRHKILTFVYRRTEILQGRWIDLTLNRKIFVGITVSISIVIYLVYLLFIRALNSITLSINVFSTLGFGAIPVKGVSRYITIIEGFLGWFLLSIFSVSLISQMLQS